MQVTEQIIRESLEAYVEQLCAAGGLHAGAQIVLGCSTSEIAGGTIGKNSAPEMGEWVARAFLEACEKRGVTPIAQCCEHLNRALVLPLHSAQRFGYTPVCALPMPHAGGSLAAALWRALPEPALCETVRADAGIDIGDTLIGMHLKRVAVPLRPKCALLGGARVVMAYTRPAYIGGARAVYPSKEGN